MSYFGKERPINQNYMSFSATYSTNHCRGCQAPLTHSFADLGMSPVSNNYVDPTQANTMEPFYPLHAFVCSNCLLVQLPAYQKREEIFTSEYAYFSSYSDSWLNHVKKYVADVTTRFHLNVNSRVVEIASNDGYLLQYFVEQGVPVLGVEPCRNVAEAARKIGIPTLIQFFGHDTATSMVAAGQQADLLIGNNVLAHVPDVNDLVAGMKLLVKPTGIITMEFPHLLRLMVANQFDTIYHEHFSYFSLLAVEKIFAAHGLRIFDVEELSTHGGSLRMYVRHEEYAARPVTARVHALRETEEKAGLDRLETYGQWQENIYEAKRSFLAWLIDVKKKGKTVVGYGAPAKGNTFLNYCGVRTDFIDYTVDRNPHKQGQLLPGTHIPIYAPEKIAHTKPDYVLILPWNLKDEIASQLNYIRDWGGQFVVAIPATKIW